MRIDCGTCAVQGAACADCVVTFLTIGLRDAGTPAAAGGTSTAPLTTTAQLTTTAPLTTPAPTTGSPVDLDDAERAAIEVLASSGLVPPLRLVPRPASRLAGPRSRAG